jgi:hypothetical protein
MKWLKARKSSATEMVERRPPNPTWNPHEVTSGLRNHLSGFARSEKSRELAYAEEEPSLGSVKST